MREATGTRSQEKAWQMASSVNRVCQGSAPPQHPAASAPALPAGKPLNSQSSEEQMPWQSWFSRAISLPLPCSSSFPIPVPHSPPNVELPTLGSPLHVPQKIPVAGQEMSPSCPQSLPGAEATSLSQAGPLPAPVTCLSPPALLAGGSLHSGKTCEY